MPKLWVEDRQNTYYTTYIGKHVVQYYQFKTELCQLFHTGDLSIELVK